MSRLIIIFALVFPVLVRAETCQELLNKKLQTEAEITRLTELQTQNSMLYKQFQNDISKKIKISSNLIIISNKIETAALILADFNKQFTQTGCK